jgi:hypothetical protein
MDDVDPWVFKQGVCVCLHFRHCPPPLEKDPGVTWTKGTLSQSDKVLWGNLSRISTTKHQDWICQAKSHCLWVEPSISVGSQIHFSWILPLDPLLLWICCRRSGLEAQWSLSAQSLCTCWSPKECISVLCPYQFLLSRFSCEVVPTQVIHSNSAWSNWLTFCSGKPWFPDANLSVSELSKLQGPIKEWLVTLSISILILSINKPKVHIQSSEKTATGHGSEQTNLSRAAVEATKQARRVARTAACRKSRMFSVGGSRVYEVQKGKAWSAGLCSPKNGQEVKLINCLLEVVHPSRIYDQVLPINLGSSN